MSDCKTTYALGQNGLGSGPTRWVLYMTPECGCCGFATSDLAPVGKLTLKELSADSGLSMADCRKLRDGDRITL